MSEINLLFLATIKREIAEIFTITDPIRFEYNGIIDFTLSPNDRYANKKKHLEKMLNETRKSFCYFGNYITKIDDIKYISETKINLNTNNRANCQDNQSTNNGSGNINVIYTIHSIQLYPNMIINKCKIKEIKKEFIICDYIDNSEASIIFIKIDDSELNLISDITKPGDYLPLQIKEFDAILGYSKLLAGAKLFVPSISRTLIKISKKKTKDLIYEDDIKKICIEIKNTIQLINQNSESKFFKLIRVSQKILDKIPIEDNIKKIPDLDAIYLETYSINLLSNFSEINLDNKQYDNLEIEYYKFIMLYLRNLLEFLFYIYCFDNYYYKINGYSTLLELNYLKS